MLESLFNRDAGLKPCNFIKKRLQHRFFSMNIAKILRTAILKNLYEQLLLNIIVKLIASISTGIQRLKWDSASYRNVNAQKSFPLRISSVNVTKSAVSSGFGHIY